MSEEEEAVPGKSKIYNKIKTVDGQYGGGKVFDTGTKKTFDAVTKTKAKQDKVTIEVKEKKDSEGNLTVTTIKTIKTPDWKTKTKTKTEFIPADEVEEYRKRQG